VPTVIVAIPSEDDYVWKVSSEKVPHLTLLNLGEETDPTGDIASYLEHAVKTSMCRFGLNVSHRGPLGPSEADVLFFERRGFEFDKLEDFRGALRRNRNIDKAYNSVEQFPEWIPHLTLGFPETPALPDKRDWPGFSWVNFNKIALWTGESTGPEFLLKDNLDWGLSMSENVDHFLEHFGVKGMKWGSRKSADGSSGSSRRKLSRSTSPDAENAQSALTKIKKGGIKSVSNKELQDVITRMNLEQQYSRVAPQGPASKAAQFGGKFAADVLIGVGKSQAIKIVGDQATKLVALAMASKK